MVFVIGEHCIDVKDKQCIAVCPVDCIYEGDRKLYINPLECIDCGACEPECPVQAIFIDDDAPDGEEWSIDDNRAFFTEKLPGRTVSLGMPGGARTLGPLSVDTPTVADLVKES